jgi:hypothetical protein
MTDAGKTTLGGMMQAIQLYTVYMDDLQGPEKINYTCRKTMHRGPMDRSFTNKFKINNMLANDGQRYMLFLLNC